MGSYATIRSIEKKVRSSKVYHDWIIRNKSACCTICGAKYPLQCHHIVELYHIILGLWKLYGDEDKTFRHVLDLHSDDKCECVTLCDPCHAKRHPGRAVIARQNVRVDLWTVIPRNAKLPLNHSVSHRPNALGLVGFQTLLGIGWHVINQKPESRIVEFHRRRFAELLGKEPGTSFNHSLKRAIAELHNLGFIVASHTSKNSVEIHLAKSYLTELLENPWFMPLDDIKASQMCILALRWFLGMQSNKKRYRIGLDKLTRHIGITTKSPQMAAKAVRQACEKISWASVDIAKGMCSFSIKQRGATPIFSLRQILEDSLTK